MRGSDGVCLYLAEQLRLDPVQLLGHGVETSWVLKGAETQREAREAKMLGAKAHATRGTCKKNFVSVGLEAVPEQREM